MSSNKLNEFAQRYFTTFQVNYNTMNMPMPSRAAMQLANEMTVNATMSQWAIEKLADIHHSLEEEKQLRDQYPSVHEAYDKYQTLLALVK